MTGSLWHYYRDETTNPLSSNSDSFKYKNNITGNTYHIGATEEGYVQRKLVKMKLKLEYH